MQEIIKKTIPFPVTTKQFAVAVAIGWLIIGWTFIYNKESDFEKCNNNFVNATNAVEKYNRDYPMYKVALPTYICSWETKKKV